MKDKINALAASNALEHGGKAEFNSVVSKFIAHFPNEKKRLKELIPVIRESVEFVNSVGSEEQANLVRREYPELLEKKKREEETKRLPDLPDIPANGVVMRMAPSPSGPLHIGHARMAILNDEYVKRYGGKLILRIEDTNPANIDPDAYEMISSDLEWLEVSVTDRIIQSDRFDLYYKVMEKLLGLGKAYVATTASEEFKTKRQEGIPIKERDDPPEINLERWERMKSGDFEKGKVYAVIKTDLDHPNPAIRDFIAFRIVDIPHPLTGTKYHAYPMMNFSVAVDDHYLGLTHIIRGKDHTANTEKQKYIFDYLKWGIPYYLHYGKVSIEGSVLKTSLIKKGIRSGEFSGWDDPRLGTLLSFKKRGFDPKAIRKYYVESGIGNVDTTFSWDIFYAFNRQIIDSRSPRHFFVNSPVKLKFDYSGTLLARMPLYPSHSHEGDGLFREYQVSGGEIAIARDDYERNMGGEVRLKGLGNFTIAENSISFRGNPLKDSEGTSETKPRADRSIPIIHWLKDNYVEYRIYRQDGTVDTGYLERDSLNYKGMVHQLERYGYVNILNEKEGFFTHP